MIKDAAACMLALTALTVLAAPFALSARHRTAGKVIPALTLGAVILVAATAVVAS